MVQINYDYGDLEDLHIFSEAPFIENIKNLKMETVSDWYTKVKWSYLGISIDNPPTRVINGIVYSLIQIYKSDKGNTIKEYIRNK